MIALGLAVVVVILLGLAVWAGRRVPHPEQTAGHGRVPPDTTSDRFYRTADRPAGPDAEDPILPDREPPP